MSQKPSLRLQGLPKKGQGGQAARPGGGPGVDVLFQRAHDRLSRFKAHIIVLSGKGGVGKTFISTSLALYLARRGLKVGLFDADETGAAVPFVLGERNTEVYVVEKTKELLPLESRYGIKFMSIEPFLPEGETPLLWEGALRTRFIVDTLSNTRWGDLDIMVYDLPPGTGDEVITIAQVIPSPRFAIIVSSPGVIAESVVRKAIVFAQKMQLPIMGLVENMSYVDCDGVRYEVLGESTAEKLSREYGVEVLARIPMDPVVRRAHDEGKPVYELAPGSEIDYVLSELAEKVYRNLRLLGLV